MTEAQRGLVRDNLGLVGVHLRRFVPQASRSPRDWDDLFQEGCLGLIRAALAYDPAGGMEFPRFAFPRIRCAVSEALLERRRPTAMPRLPRQRHRGRDGKHRHRPDGELGGVAARHQHRPDVEHTGGDGVGPTGGERPHDPSDPPNSRTIAAELAHYSLRRRQNPTDPPQGETIGSRLRDKIDRALRQAATLEGERRSKRDDRSGVMARLVEERLLVPQAESRAPLRQIARETGSSCARIIQCEERLLAAAKEALTADPEFAELRSKARSGPVGLDTESDPALEGKLAERSAADFLAQLRRAGPRDKAMLLARLLEVSPAELDELLGRQLARLPHELRECVLRPSGKDAQPSPVGETSRHSAK